MEAMTEAEPLEVVRRHYDAFARADWHPLFKLYHPDIEVDLSRSGIPGLGTYSGHAGVRTGWTKWRGAWDRFDLEVEELLASGERVLALNRIRARSRGQGVETEVEGADLYTVRDGLIVRFAAYLDRDEARRDAGL
jgi:ketosteroid isomerase-like protein